MQHKATIYFKLWLIFMCGADSVNWTSIRCYIAENIGLMVMTAIKCTEIYIALRFLPASSCAAGGELGRRMNQSSKIIIV